MTVGMNYGGPASQHDFFSPEWRFLATDPALSIETKFALSRCSFSDQMPKFFISFDEVDQLGV
jgi:hypothetical protein